MQMTCIYFDDRLCLSLSFNQEENMKASIARFRPSGPLELYFPTWEVDGRVLKGIHLHPHRCDPKVCEYGDHVHVDLYDEPVEIVAQDAVELSPVQEEAITAFLRAQLAVNALTHKLEELIHSHQPLTTAN